MAAGATRLKRKSSAACALALVVACVVAAPAVAAVVVDNPRLVRKVQAWWVGAEYVGEAGVIRQRTAYDCGGVSLLMALREKGLHATLERVREQAGTTDRGTSLLGLKRAAEANGLTAATWKLTPRDLRRVPLPAIAFVEGDHYVVIDGVTSDGRLIVLDPARGRLSYMPEAFARHWKGEALVLGEFSG